MIARTLQLYKSALSGFSRDIWVLSIIMLINRSGMMVLPFMSLYLIDVLGYTLPQSGWVLSSFGAGALAGSFMGGKLADRFGFYPVMFWTLLIQGLMFFLLLQVSSFPMMCLMVFLTSTIGDAFRPANFVAIAAYSSPQNRTRSLGLQRLAINLGMAIGPAIGGIIAVSGGYSWLFIIDGITCMVAALAFRWSLPPKQHQIVKEHTTSLHSAYRDWRYFFFLVLVLFNAMAFFQLFTTLPVFLKEHIGMMENHIGQLIAYNCLLIVVFEMPLIYSIEGRYTKWQITAWGALLIGVSFALFNILGWTILIAFVVMTILTFGEILTLPFLSSLAMERSDRGNRGEYMGLYTMTYSVAHILAPMLGMQIASNWGFDTLWYFCFWIDSNYIS